MPARELSTPRGVDGVRQPAPLPPRPLLTDFLVHLKTRNKKASYQLVDGWTTRPIRLSTHTRDLRFLMPTMPAKSQAQVRSKRMKGLAFSLPRQAAPEDIILGPPKTAFASANSRNALKSTTADRSDEAPAANKRFSFNERPPRDRDVADGEKKDGRYNGMSNRRLGRDDREDWQNSRQRRHNDPEEGEGRSRRNGDKDRPRWEKESKDQEVGAGAKRLSRDAARRDGRGKFDQPWFRGEKANEGGEDDTKVPTKQQEWRRDRGSGRGPDWDRPSKAEQDPEWMDSTASSEPRQAHTQEEFQRWKESMKSGAEGRDRVSEKQETEPQPEIKKPEPPPVPAFLQVSEVESGMDKFFAVYGDRKMSSEPKPAEVKAQRKPRFAALFSPQPEDGAKVSSYVDFIDVAQPQSLPMAPAAPAPINANNADQEHFQRVLQMLAGRSSNNTPQSATVPKASKDNNDREEPRQPREEPKEADLHQQQDEVHMQGDHSRDRGFAGINGPPRDRLLEPQQRAPREPTPSRDADLLLRLMQQSGMDQDSKPSRTSQPDVPGSAREPIPSRGSFSWQPPVERSDNNLPTFFDDPAVSQMQRPEHQPQRESQQRRPTNGPPPPPAFFDEPFFNNLRQANQQPTVGNPESGTQPRASALPPGMQRPPGFDHMTAHSTSWQNQNQNQIQPPPRPQQQPGPHSNNNAGMAQPPGIPNPTARAMNTAYSAAGPPPMPQNHIMQSPHHQLPPPLPHRQRKYTGDNGIPGYPLTMGLPAPPPGFMNAPPQLPPGFAGMQPPPLRGGGGGQQQFPDVSGTGMMLPRHLMDMLAGGQRGEGGGGADAGGTTGGGMSGHYR